MGKLFYLLQKYKTVNVIPPLEEEQAQLYEYVYTTNRLEGNQVIAFANYRTIQSDTISGTNIRNSDILEQKGMYRALKKNVIGSKKQRRIVCKINFRIELVVHW